MESSIYASEDQKSVIYNNVLIVDIEDILLKALVNIKEIDIYQIDTQKILLNYFIIEVCEHLKRNNNIKNILYLNTLLPLINIYEAPVFLKLIEKILKILSISYIKQPYSLNIFYKNLLSKSDSELVSFELANSYSKKNNTSKKIVAFLKRNGLTFLHDTYFKDPSNKLVLFK
jgi:hypothetical protein